MHVHKWCVILSINCPLAQVLGVGHKHAGAGTDAGAETGAGAGVPVSGLCCHSRAPPWSTVKSTCGVCQP